MPKTFNDLIIRRLGINSRNQWNINYQNKLDFNDFFMTCYPLLEKKLQISKKDIINFK